MHQALLEIHHAKNFLPLLEEGGRVCTQHETTHLPQVERLSHLEAAHELGTRDHILVVQSHSIARNPHLDFLSLVITIVVFHHLKFAVE